MKWIINAITSGASANFGLILLFQNPLDMPNPLVTILGVLCLISAIFTMKFTIEDYVLDKVIKKSFNNTQFRHKLLNKKGQRTNG